MTSEKDIDFKKVLDIVKEIKYSTNGIIYRIDFIESNIKEQLEMENYSNVSQSALEKHKEYIMERFEDVLVDTIFYSEKAFKEARNLYKIAEDCIALNTKKDFDKGKTIDEDITFEVLNDDVFYFRLPELLKIKNMKPRKTNNMTDEIYRQIMREKINEKLDALEKERRHIEIFKEHTLVFIHHFTDLTEKDMDNLSLKKIIDVLSEKLVVDDSMRFNNIIQLSKKDKTTHTELYVIRGQEIKKNILEFLAEKC